MNVSIVIPVYNEAELLQTCLEAIAAQTIAPLEVIVVDNNSTDDTVRVAQGFDFVTLLHEPQQGVLHARTRGFNAARGDIIARIDGDSVVAPDWIASIQHILSDPTIDAVSGSAQYYHAAFATVFSDIDRFFRRRLHHQLKDRVYLWGANMAMRRSAWQDVRTHLCQRGGIHEDYDLAIHLQELGRRVWFDERMQVGVSARRIDASYIDFMRYVLKSPDTYAQHRIRERWHMYEVVAVCALGYIPARIVRRAYDPRTQGFSWTQLLKAPAPARPDPTTNVV